jgi:hypothetical protein
LQARNLEIHQDDEQPILGCWQWAGGIRTVTPSGSRQSFPCPRNHHTCQLYSTPAGKFNNHNIRRPSPHDARHRPHPARDPGPPASPPHGAGETPASGGLRPFHRTTGDGCSPFALYRLSHSTGSR